MILLVGQYSTGKTTFIKYLLERDFPGIRIGPEPTTDRFIAVMYGDQDGVSDWAKRGVRKIFGWGKEGCRVGNQMPRLRRFSISCLSLHD